MTETAMLPTRLQFLLLALLMCCIAATYIITDVTAARGRLVAPLDDAYITYQYARQIAHGQLYRYNDGDPSTTGMTSPLFGFLLAGLHLLGFVNERLPALATAPGALWLGLIAMLVYRISARLLGRQASTIWPWSAACLTALTGAVQWSCFNGMETGLFTVLTLAALDTFLAGGPGPLWLSLSALTRPEGLVLAGLIWAITGVRETASFGRVPWKQLATLTIPLVVGLIPSGVNWALTGSASSAGLVAKSWWGNVPFYPDEIIRSILTFYSRIILEQFLGWAPPNHWFIAPGVFVLALVGWVGLAKRRRWVEMLITSSWFLVGTLSTANLITALWHQGRYQVPFAPIVMG